MKRLNAPYHWMLDKLGGIFVRSFAFRTQLQTYLSLCIFMC